MYRHNSLVAPMLSFSVWARLRFLGCCRALLSSSSNTQLSAGHSSAESEVRSAPCADESEPLPLLDFETPLDLRKYTREQLNELSRKKLEHRDQSTQATITVLGTGGNEISPSFFLRCVSRSYRFNIGEGWTRMVGAYQCNVSKDPLNLFTRAHWDTCGGALGLFYTEALQHERQQYLGPRRMQLRFMRYLQRYTGRWSWKNVGPEEDQYGELFQLKDENLRISMIPINPEVVGGGFDAGNFDGNVGTVVAYSCKLCDVPGKFHPEKALELGVPRGPVYRLLTHGVSIITKQGNLVRSSQVMEDRKHGPTFLVVDCPSHDFLEALTSNRYLQPDHHAQQGENVVLIVHMTPLELLQTEEYCRWVASFGADTRHLFLHASVCPSEVGWHNATKFMLMSHMVNPSVYNFPCLPLANTLSKSDLNVTKSIGEDSAVIGRTFMKYVLKPQVSLDVSECLSSPEKQLKADMELIAKEPGLNRIGIHLQKTGRSPLDLPHIFSSVTKRKNSRIQLACPDDVAITMLGTSSTTSTKHRNCSGILIHTPSNGNFLLDCGEGTLQQLHRRFGPQGAREVLKNLNAVFISHMHPDHHMGLVGLLNEMQTLERERGVRVIANEIQMGIIQEFGVCVNQDVESILSYELVRHPFAFSGDITMETVPVNHIRGAHGCILRNRDKWSIVYSGDTAPSQRLIEAGQDATLLIHEATFEDFFTDEARKTKHCTYSEAVRVGRAMNAGFLITTHFSVRSWFFPMLRQYWRSGVTPAMDFMTVKLSDVQEQQLDSNSCHTALNTAAIPLSNEDVNL